MEEMMVMTSEDPPTTITTLPSWKLYNNPLHYTHHHHQHHRHNPLYLPLSARKIAACLWDLTFVRSIMDSDLDVARAQIIELKAELEYERRLRKKAESLNRNMYRELQEEKKKRENAQDVYEKLVQDISSEKVEIDMMKKEMSEERKMLRMAEMLREERVQMKLSEAKILLEEKLSELEVLKGGVHVQVEASPVKVKKPKDDGDTMRVLTPNESITTTTTTTIGHCENTSTNNNNGIGLFVPSSTMVSKRRASPEAENPHIKRGIKGFVEYPRVVRAMSSKGRQLGSKVECQKAQLRFLLRQKSPIRTDNLIIG